jgi:hypothetical protein
MKTFSLAIVGGSLMLAGCSSMPSLSTGSIFGGSTAPSGATNVLPAAEAAPTSDPTSRAFQVGTVAARAVKCGYNFDPAKLRAAFLAAEVGGGASTADAQRIQQIYDVSYNGVVKATAADPAYCTEQRTKDIKTDLSRHLAGDYAPPPRKQVAQESGGFLSDWGSSGSKDTGPKFQHPMDNR